MTGMTLGNGVNETLTYSDDRLQLTQQKVMKGATTLMKLNYNYQAQIGESGAATTVGNSGQLMHIDSASTINGQSRTQDFTYDDLGRLVTAKGWNTWQRRFSYDRWGNRIGVWDATAGGNQIQSVTLRQQAGAPTGVPSNQMLTVTQGGSPLTQSYDAVGNLTSDGVHTYQYDAAGRLAKVDAGSASEASYFYDSGNWRLKKVVGTGASAVTTVYIGEGGAVISEYSSAPPPGSGGTKYYHADRLSTRMTTDGATGNIVGTQDQLPFGEDAATSGQTEKHRFTNYERDNESGTDYAVNRQYGNATGRFLRPDPVGGSAGSPQSLNRYHAREGEGSGVQIAIRLIRLAVSC